MGNETKHTQKYTNNNSNTIKREKEEIYFISLNKYGNSNKINIFLV